MKTKLLKFKNERWYFKFSDRDSAIDIDTKAYTFGRANIGDLVLVLDIWKNEYKVISKYGIAYIFTSDVEYEQIF